MLRFSTKALFAVVLVAAFLSAGLAKPTYLFVQCTLLPTVLVLLVFTLWAIAGRLRRSFAVGFAVTGWAWPLEKLILT